MSKIAFDRLSFLVVDDNSHMRRLVRSLLHGFGSRQVYEAEDGAAGLEGVENYSPDILITDWAMPIFDGLELLQMIRNPDSCKNAYIPIIMLTGHSEKERVIQARNYGVTEFLCKPISAKSLYDRIFSIVLNPRPFIKTPKYFGPDRRRVVNANYQGKERRAEDRGETESQDDIDNMFDGAGAGTESQDDIDNMFDEAGAETESQDDIDNMFDEAGAETESQDDIDNMFDGAGAEMETAALEETGKETAA